MRSKRIIKRDNIYAFTNGTMKPQKKIFATNLERKDLNYQTLTDGVVEAAGRVSASKPITEIFTL